nr:PREDICTED: von Willebrand factor A domain-containing protein 7-like [Notothenia coriiceps]
MTSVLGIALLTFALSGSAVAFVPIGGGASTHVSITATALLQKVTETCRVVAEAAGHEFKPTGLSPEELVQACLGPRATGEVSGAKFHSALQDIYTQNGLVDRDFVSSAPHHFNSENFVQGRTLIMEGMAAIKANIGKENFKAARETLGRILHTLQDFYSHSNWVELGNTKPYINLIRPDLPLDNLADIDTPTCSDCASGTCPNTILPNILSEKKLTSGYMGIFSSDKPQGKCSHGGEADLTSTTHPRGGISKDERRSDNVALHNAAVTIATAASLELLEDLRLAAGNDDYLRDRRRLRSFNVCTRLLQMFYQSVVASVLFFAVVCWGGNKNTRDTGRLNKLVRKASSVVGVQLDNLEEVAEGRARRKLDRILENPSHPLHAELVKMRSTFSHRLIPPQQRTKRLGQMMGIARSAVVCFVIDTTGSMSEDIDAARAVVYEIIDSKKGTQDEPSEYILVPFNDPDFGPMIRTTDPDKMKSEIAKLRANAGGDTPEMCLSGLLLALTGAPSSSYIYVFTDAVAKDIYLKATVIALTRSTKSTVSFFLTAPFRRRRRFTRAANLDVYKELALASGGQVVQVSKKDLPQATGVILDTSTSALVTVIQRARNPGKQETFPFMLDESLKNITIYITGTKIAFTLTNPAGVSSSQVDTIGKLGTLQTVGNLWRIRLNADSLEGNWQLNVNSNQQYTLKVTAFVLSVTLLILGYAI